MPKPSLTKALIEIENRARQPFGSTLTDSVIGYTTLTLFFSSTLERDRTGHGSGASGSHRFDESPDLNIQQPMLSHMLYHPSVAQTSSGLPMTVVSASTTSSLHWYLFRLCHRICTGVCYLGPCPRPTNAETRYTQSDSPRRGGRHCRCANRGLSLRLTWGMAAHRPVPSRF